MTDALVLINTATAIIAVIVLIVRFGLNPVVALILGSVYLGLVSGLGATGTVETITTGFGEIMAEVGLLIGFGVLIGAMLNEMRAIERLVTKLLNVFGPKKLPYTLSFSVGTFLQAIFLDVLLVIAAPLVRKLAPQIDKFGTGRLAAALAIGGEVGVVLMVPGVGALALAGVLGVPVGRMLIFGLIVVIPTVLISVAAMNLLFRFGFWDPAKDEMTLNGAVVSGSNDEDHSFGAAGSGASGHASANYSEGDGENPSAVVTIDRSTARQPALLLLFAPLLFSLMLIAVGAIAMIMDVGNPVIDLLTEPAIALLIGVIGTSLLGRLTFGQSVVEKAIANGYRESGQILMLTAVGGSLAATVSAVGLGEILGGYFSATTFAPLLMVWLIAAVLHIAVGSVTISAITAAGMLEPVSSVIGLDPVLLALAAGAGSLFAVHVTSNTFWLLQSLLGQTTRGTLKTCSIGVSIASVIAIAIIMPLSLLF